MKLNLKVPNIALFNTAKALTVYDKLATKYVDAITSTFQASIISKAPTGGSGRLKNSIKTKRKKYTGIVYPSVKYAEFVERGRRAGRMPPSKRLVNWLKRSRKGRNRFQALKARYPRITYKSAAYLVARAIGKHGTRPTWFWSKGEAQALPVVNALKMSFYREYVKGLKK